ncbi:hypothetical protein C900_00600 [Fulvivirga imtechensis AK7]|uniref:Uncharacterized protein n=1 Tax=Fulvivirga imtechensis AK7 TaxID=1237149 RepID=L8JHE2_9BACT|nr:hypothetical protein C900_00600 [Fulvivirga imtechensis AK7]
MGEVAVPKQPHEGGFGLDGFLKPLKVFLQGKLRDKKSSQTPLTAFMA